jgi:hypothetical protein
LSEAPKNEKGLNFISFYDRGGAKKLQEIKGILTIFCWECPLRQSGLAEGPGFPLVLLASLFCRLPELPAVRRPLGCGVPLQSLIRYNSGKKSNGDRYVYS